VLIAGEIAIRFLRRSLDKIMKRRKINFSLQPFLDSLIAVVLQVVLFLFLLQILGIKLTLFAALVAALGAAVGLSLSGTLQNFASGVLILLLKPFKNGDNIVTQGQEGTVTSIQIFYTLVTTYDKRTVIIPNSKLSNEVILNITQQGVRRLDIPLKFPYKTDIAAVRKLLISTLAQIPEALKDPAIRVGVSELEESNYIVTTNVWLNAHGFEDARLRILERILDSINSSGLKST
jgi:small conductance mechanosensitive channel